MALRHTLTVNWWLKGLQCEKGTLEPLPVAFLHQANPTFCQQPVTNSYTTSHFEISHKRDKADLIPLATSWTCGQARVPQATALNLRT